MTYYFVRPGALHPYLRGSVNLARATGSMSSDAVQMHQLMGAAGLLMLFSDAVGLDAQLFEGRIDSDVGSNTTSVFGLRFGISAYVS